MQKGKVKEMPKGALAYNIPGKAKASLTYNGKNIFYGEFQVAQFGVVFGLALTCSITKSSGSCDFLS